MMTRHETRDDAEDEEQGGADDGKKKECLHWKCVFRFEVSYQRGAGETSDGEAGAHREGRDAALRRGRSGHDRRLPSDLRGGEEDEEGGSATI